MSRLVVKLKDYDGDVQQISVPGVIGDSGASYDAMETAALALRDEILAVTLGANAGHQIVADDVALNPATPSDPFAQTNIQWIIQYVDDVTSSVRTMRIGTADLALADALYNGAPALNIGAGGAGNALATAFEAFVLNEGHAVTVQAIYFRE